MISYADGIAWTPVRHIQAKGRSLRVTRSILINPMPAGQTKPRMYKRDGFWCLDCPHTHLQLTGLAPQYVYADYLEALANRKRIY